jgi:hypothetical protein
MTSPIPSLSVAHAVAGPPILPIKRVWIMTDKEFEKLVEAWADSLKGRYISVAHFGGAGDKAVDVAGFYDDRGFKGVWEGFQCKHLNHPLRPKDVYAEIGKLIWFISRGDYVSPRLYGFVGSQDLGTSLTQFLHDPVALKADVEANWDSKIAGKITKKARVELNGAVKAVFDAIDWTIFKHQKLQTLLDGLKGTAYFITTFGGGLPDRPEPAPMPSDIQPNEIIYVEKLRQAYCNHTGNIIPDVPAIANSRTLSRHFENQRSEVAPVVCTKIPRC